MEFSTDAIQVLVYLAPGYLAYRIYKIDSPWSAIPTISIAYGSLAFSAVGYMLGAFTSKFLSEHAIVVSSNLLSFFFAIGAGLLWRVFGHPWFHWLLRKAHISNEDNRGDVWQKVFNDPRLFLSQIRVYLKTGEAFACDDTHSLGTPERERIGIYPYYAHDDRQIGFIPTHTKKPGDTEWRDAKDIDAPGWGVRFVIFNPEEIQYMDVRMMETKSVGKTANPHFSHCCMTG